MRLHSYPYGSREDYLQEAEYSRKQARNDRTLFVGGLAAAGALSALSAEAFTLGGIAMIDGVISTAVTTVTVLGSLKMRVSAQEYDHEAERYRATAPSRPTAAEMSVLDTASTERPS